MITPSQVQQLLSIRTAIDNLIAESNIEVESSWQSKGKQIISCVANANGLLYNQLVGKRCHSPRLVWPRYMALHLCDVFINPKPSIRELAILFQKTDGWVLDARNMNTKIPIPINYHKDFDNISKYLTTTIK